MGIGYLYITGKQNDKHILDCKIQTMKYVKKMRMVKLVETEVK